MIPACETCGAEFDVLFPGADPERVDLLDTPITRGERGFTLCMTHARERGWPNYPAETQKVYA